MSNEDEDYSFLNSKSFDCSEIKLDDKSRDISYQSNDISHTFCQGEIETKGSPGLTNKDGIPCVIGGNYPKDFLDMVSRISNQYMMLPVLDYKAIYKELSSLTVNSNPTPTFQTLNQELQKVQAAKERVCEIALDIIKCYSIKKRAVDILQDSWGNFSQEKSADKRKGDAIHRLSDFSMDFANVEAALKVVSHVTKNLDGLQENLSKRLSSMQSQLRMHDIGINTLPDTSFGNDVDDWQTNSSTTATPTATLSNEF